MENQATNAIDSNQTPSYFEYRVLLWLVLFLGAAFTMSHFVFKQTINQGEAIYYHYMGAKYYNGTPSFDKDLNKASQMFQKASEQGHYYSRYILGHMYEQGQGVPKDYQMAFNLYRTAAENGEPEAQDALGRVYYQGAYVTKDLVQSYIWYDLSSQQGHLNASLYKKKILRELSIEDLAKAKALSKEYSEKYVKPFQHK